MLTHVIFLCLVVRQFDPGGGRRAPSNFVDLRPAASNFHGAEVDSTDQSRRDHFFPRRHI